MQVLTYTTSSLEELSWQSHHVELSEFFLEDYKIGKFPEYLLPVSSVLAAFCCSCLCPLMTTLALLDEDVSPDLRMGS